MPARADRGRAATAVLVLGMHRSGTSAVAGALRLLGARLGDRLVPAADDNAKGYWEDADVVDLHERLLAGLSRSWDDVRDLPSQWRTSDSAREAGAGIRRVVEGFAGDRLWAVKDPRMSRVVPLWLEEIRRAGQRAACVFVVRHPDEVAASLQARNRLPAVVGQLLWLRHVLDAVRDAADAPRVMIRYEQLLESPTRCFQRVGERLGIEWPTPIETARAELHGFVDGAERHQAAGSGLPSPDGPLGALVRDLYAQCVAVSDDQGDWAGFEPLFDAADRVFEAVAPWLELIGAVQEADAAALRKLDAAHRVQLEAVEGAKRDAERMAIERLRELQHTTADLDATRRLALERQSQLEDLSRAHRDAEALAVARLAQVEGIAKALEQANALALDRQAQLVASATAHHAAEALARQRLGEVERLATELDGATALALSRLADLQRLAAAHDEAAALALERLAEIQRLSAALDAANALALARLDELHAWAKAKEEIEQVALARLAEVEALAERLAGANARVSEREGELEIATQAIGDHRASIARLEAEVADLQAELHAMRSTLSWKLSAPVRAVEAWRRRRASRDA